MRLTALNAQCARIRRGLCERLLTVLLVVSSLLVSPPIIRSQGETNEEGPAEQTVQTASVVRRKDVPPGDVSRLLTTGQMGGGLVAAYCTLPAGGKLTVDQYPTDHGLGVAGCALPVGGDLQVDLEGYPVGALDILVRRPDGTQKATQIIPEPLDTWSRFVWVAYPGDPLGQYELSVTAAGVTTSGTFIVGVGINPQARVEPDWGTARHHLQGLPGQLPARVFRGAVSVSRGGRGLRPLVDAGRVALDSRGEAVVNLPTLPDDDLGEYMLWTVPKIHGATANSAPKFQINTGPEWLSGDPPDEVVRTFVQMANEVWASVIARDGAPADYLECVYAGPWLDSIRQDVLAMRAAGQYRVARMVAPIEIVRIEKSAYDRHEAVVKEYWDDKLFDSAGTLLRSAPPTLEQRYVIERYAKRSSVEAPEAPDSCRQSLSITESQITRP